MTAASAAAAASIPEPNNDWSREASDPHEQLTEQSGEVVRHGWLGQIRGDVGTIAEPRPALAGLTTSTRPFDKWAADTMSGLHGAIVHRADRVDMGDMEPWNPQITTERNAPTVPWDHGVTLGSSALTDRL